jgi:hypothetical protein
MRTYFKIQFLVSALAVLFLSGCATLFEGRTQNITLSTINDKDISKTRCTLANEEGSWIAAPNTSTNVHRDGNNLEIHCENDEQKGDSSLHSSFNGGYLALDLLFDICIISCFVDGINNSFYEYPKNVSVTMMNTGRNKE